MADFKWLNKDQLSTEINDSLNLADSSLQSSDIWTSVQAHSTVLDNTTASFTTADETKLDWIESWAEVNEVTLAGTETLTNKDLTSITNTFPTNIEDIKDITPTKWDVIVYNGTNWVDVWVGTNDQVLTADSTQSAWVAWKDVWGGGWSSDFLSAYRSSDQSITSGVFTTILFNVKDTDPWSNYNTSTWIYTVPSDWTYYIESTIFFQSVTDVLTNIVINWTTIKTDDKWWANTDLTQHLSIIRPLVTNDEIEIELRHFSWSNRNVEWSSQRLSTINIFKIA